MIRSHPEPRSEAIRRAILESAGRLRKRAALAAEVVALEADERDRREMLEVADFMESMRSQGDIHEFRPARGTGHEQRDRRYGVSVQANELLPRTVVLVAPTSHDLLGQTTSVLVEQAGAVDAGRLGDPIGRVTQSSNGASTKHC